MKKEAKPSYLFVTRKFMASIISALVALVIGVVTSFQYTQYVDRRSNQRLCGVVTISNDATRSAPDTETRRKLLIEFQTLLKDFDCK